MRKIFLKPLNHLQIQMVCRFVKNKDIRFTKQYICKSDSLTLSAGQILHFFVKIGYFQFRQDFLYLIFIVPCTGNIQTICIFGNCFVVILRNALKVHSYDIRELITIVQTSFKNRLFGRVIRSLFKIANLYVLTINYRTTIVAFFTAKNIKKRRFSRAVTPNKSNFLSFQHTERSIVHDSQIANSLTQ